MFSLMCTWPNDSTNSRDAAYLTRHRVHCDVTVMKYWPRMYFGNGNCGAASVENFVRMTFPFQCIVTTWCTDMSAYKGAVSFPFPRELPNLTCINLNFKVDINFFLFVLLRHGCKYIIGCSMILFYAWGFCYSAWLSHDDVIKWKHFPRNWPFVRGIHRSRWLPRTKASDADLWCFLWSASE